MHVKVSFDNTTILKVPGPVKFSLNKLSIWSTLFKLNYDNLHLYSLTLIYTWQSSRYQVMLLQSH